MNCPRCATALSTRPVGRVAVEGCERCGGLFLDHGVLDRIAEPHDGDLEFSTLDDETFVHDDKFAVIRCPRCSTEPMKKVEFNIYTDIILDHCARCRAFWLDGPELARINDEVRELNEASTEPVAPAMLWFASFIWSLPR